MCCRIGEATNPGPPEPILGCFNPTGLLGKTPLLSQLPVSENQTVWAVSESHLTRQGKAKLKIELNAHKTGYHAQMGSDVPPRSSTISAIAGKHRGVGFLTNAPSREMPTTWDPETRSSNRVHASCFQFGSRPVLGGVVYGFPVSPESAETQQATEKLCQALTATIVDSQVGLRFIAGDFNQLDQALPSMIQWSDRGWVNAQKWAFDKFGTEIQCTCKGSTTKDHLFLSPELAMYLRSVHVENDWFPDHAILYAKLTAVGSPPMVPLWRQPAEIPWDKCPQLVNPDKPFELPDTDPSSQYEAICHELEDRVKKAMQSKDLDLFPHEMGRAKTREVRFVQEYAHPPRKGREGECQPDYTGSNLKHAQLMRQVRRIISYQRVANVSNPSASHTEYRCSVWRKIVQAPGFPGSFASWWKSLNHPTLPELPRHPVLGIQVNAIVEATTTYMRSFESSLLRTRVTQAKQRRLDDANVIFRDLQKEPNAQVQILLEETKATIMSIDADQQALEFDHPQPWKPDVPVVTHDIQALPIHVEEDKIWLPDVSQFREGQVVRQERPVGNLQDLFKLFGAEWQQRWDRHANVDESTWDPICNFADTVLPTLPPMQYEPISYDEWLQSLRRKSKRAATGPDAVSRQDLLKMPRDLTEAMLTMFHQIECSGQWPEQLLTGFVVALEKQPNAKFVNQFRPITVFPAAYRNYTSIRARQILRFLDPYVPSTCTGNLPNRYAAHMWHSLLDQIELGVHLETEVSGGVIDLVKAFNTLPRVPIMHVMSKLQIPTEILRAWSSATVHMERRFKIHNKVGPPEVSSTGYAEGCALSVVAMLGFNFLNHCWCALKQPRIQLWSYVDNIEILGDNAQEIIDGMQELAFFCKGMDVDIDHAKSYTWSINADARKALRNQSHNVVHSIRDLGCHMQYGRKVTNFTVTAKCLAMGPLWNKLARSLAPYRAKVRALRSKAWPACLHAVSAVHLADEHFTKLRTGAVRGLGEHTNGMSPPIHLSLVEHPSTDPQFHAILQTLMDYRTLGSPDVFVTVMHCMHQATPTCYPKPGPASVVLGRLQQLAWSWVQGTIFRDDRGLLCDVIFAPVQELRSRLSESWQHRVQTEYGARPSMEGLQRANAGLTMYKVPLLPPEDQAILRCCLNGSFFTADKHFAQGKLDSPACEFCGQKDSQEHRHWQCAHFEDCRKIHKAQIETLFEMDPCLRTHGWLPEPPSLHRFRSLCLDIVPSWDNMQWPPEMPHVLHLFTDGACQQPHCPWSRFASWGVALGLPEDDGFWPLTSGLVSGWTHTILRAELSAIIAACNAGLQSQRPLVLWIDNELVHRRVKQMVERGGWVKPNQKDADLWNKVLHLVRALGPQILAVCKVVSHQDHGGADTEAERWIFAGNDAADALATAAADSHPTLSHTWTTLCQDLLDLQTLRAAVHTTLIEVGRKAIYGKSASKPAATPRDPRFTPADVSEFVLPNFQELPPADRFRFDGVDHLVQWLSTLTSQDENPRLVSWFQLNALCEHQLDLPGIDHHPKQRQWHRISDRTALNFVQRANRLSRWMQGVIQESGGCCQPKHLRPQSRTIQFWTQCLLIRIPDSLLHLADNLLAAHQPHFKTVQALRGI